MADNTVSFPDLALDKFSGNDPEQDVRSFLTTVENKINFSMGHEPDNDDDRARYLFRKKALFSSLLRGPAAEWYTDNIGDGHDWQHIRTHFLTRFSDNRDKYRYRITAENSVRGNEEIIKNYFHRVKRAVDRGWPDEENADNAARAALNAQRRQKYIEFAVRGLTPNELKNKAHQYLIEHPNATWEQFQEHVTNKDLVFTISSQLAPNSSQNQKTLINELREDINAMKNMLKEQQVNSLAVTNSLPYGCPSSHWHDYHVSAVDVNNTSRQNITRFCKYCQRNGHTLQYCRKKTYDDEAKRAQLRATEEKKVTFTNDYNKRKGPGFGSQQNYQSSPRPNFTNNQRSNQQSNQNFNRGRPNEGNNRNENWNRNNSQQSNNFNNFNGNNNHSSSSRPTSTSTNLRNNTPYTGNRPNSPYNFSARPQNANSEYNRNFPTNNNSFPNSVQFIDEEGQDRVSTISFNPLNC